ncbi:MAG TPA: glycosyltransferase, partial [Gemmatimonadaceae bacterium]
FVTHSFPRFGGDVAGAFILRLARALGEGGTEVRVLAPAGAQLANVDTIDGVAVRRFRYAPRKWETLAYTGTMAEQVGDSFRGKAALAGMLSRGALALRGAAAEFAPDVIHAHWWFPAGLLALGSLSSKPLVTTLHGSDVRLARRSAWAPLLFRRVVAKSAAVTAVSGYLAAEGEAMARGRHIAVEPMPVNVELFSPGTGTRSPDRFLFVGRLNAQKGIALLLHALAATDSLASLDVVGDGPDRAELEASARALGVAGRVSWLGAQTQEQLVPLYRAATAVVIPSEGEGLGLVAVEAQLCETPVVAFRSGGLSDVVSDGVTGLLTPPGDVHALAAAMDGVIARADRGASLGRSGRQAALARFSPAVAASHYQSIYESVTHDR